MSIRLLGVSTDPAENVRPEPKRRELDPEVEEFLDELSYVCNKHGMALETSEFFMIEELGGKRARYCAPATHSWSAIDLVYDE